MYIIPSLRCCTRIKAKSDVSIARQRRRKREKHIEREREREADREISGRTISLMCVFWASAIHVRAMPVTPERGKARERERESDIDEEQRIEA